MSVPPLNISVEINLVITGEGDVRLLEVIHAAAEQTRLGVAALALAVIIHRIDISHGDVVHLLHGLFDLKLVGLNIYDKAVTVQLFALIRQLLCYDWLNDNSHLRVLLAHVPLGQDVLHAVEEHQGVGIHDGVGVDLVNGEDVHLRKVAG